MSEMSGMPEAAEMPDAAGMPETAEAPDMTEMPEETETPAAEGPRGKADKPKTPTAMWYVIHTYSGYENKVKANIEKTVGNRHFEDKILDVRVPMESVQETKNGVTKMVQRKLFPGYVLVNMIMDDDTWYVVRNTRGVTGFVGPGSKPVPLTAEEMWMLGVGKEAPKPRFAVDFEKGDVVTIIAGAWTGREGIVQSINPQRQTVTISMDLFGRETPLDIGFAEVKKK